MQYILSNLFVGAARVFWINNTLQTSSNTIKQSGVAICFHCTRLGVSNFFFAQNKNARSKIAVKKGIINQENQWAAEGPRLWVRVLWHHSYFQFPCKTNGISSFAVLKKFKIQSNALSQSIWNIWFLKKHKNAHLFNWVITLSLFRISCDFSEIQTSCHDRILCSSLINTFLTTIDNSLFLTKSSSHYMQKTIISWHHHISISCRFFETTKYT